MAFDQAQQMQDKAEEVRSKATDRVREQLDTRSTQMGEQATAVEQALRKAAEHLQAQGNDSGAKAVHRAADQVDRLAGYLSNSSSDRFLGDLESFGRGRPWAAGAAAAMLGFVGARFLKASSESRYDTSYRMRRDADSPLRRELEEVSSPMQMPVATSDYRSR